GRDQESLESFRSAVILSPDDLSLRLDVAGALERLGRAGDAIDDLFAAARIQPDDAHVLARLGAACAAANRWHESADAYQKSVRLASTADAQLGLARAKRAVADLPAAEAAFAAA